MASVTISSPIYLPPPASTPAPQILTDPAALGSLLLNAILGAGATGTTTISVGGATTIPGPSGSASLLLSLPGVFIPSTAPVTITASQGANVFAGTGGLTFLGGNGATDNIVALGGNNTITLAPGSTFDIATGAGNDKIIVDGSGVINAGTGTNTVLAAISTGTSATIISAGTGDLIAAGAGTALIGEYGTGAVIFGGSGPDTIVDAGSRNTVAGGSGPETIYGGASGVYFMSTSTTTFVASRSPTGSDTIIGEGNGSDTIFGGTSDFVNAQSAKLTFIAEGGFSYFYPSAGNTTVFGTAGSSILYNAPYGETAVPVLIAGAGNETLSARGSTGAIAIYAGSGSDSIVGGSGIVGSSGADSIFGGTGNNTADGGYGDDIFAFVNGQTGGTEMITDFQQFAQAILGTGPDQVMLSGYGPNEVANALATATTTGNNTTITLADNTKVTFAGITHLNPGLFTGI